MDVEKMLAKRINTALDDTMRSSMFGTSTVEGPQESTLTPEIFRQMVDRVKVMKALKPVTHILISPNIPNNGQITMIDRSKMDWMCDFPADVMCGHRDFIRLAREYRKHGFKIERVWKRHATALYTVS